MEVEKLLKRLRREFIKVNLIQAALDSIIGLLITNLILFLLNITLINETAHYRILIGATLTLLVIDWIIRSRKYRLEMYEEENPEFKDILRTARDNIDEQNIVSQAMFDDLIDRARDVTSESIIPNQQIIKKIVIVGGLSFLTALSGIVDFQPVQESREIFSQIEPKEILKNDKKDEKVLKNGSKILGKSKNIQTTSSKLQINIKGNAEADKTNKLRRLEKEQYQFKTSNPQLPEDAELAKQYSLSLQKIK